ncbi:MAG: hypothetical protein MUE65_04015 [Methanomassiliicoccales archaeon]|jgi:hypothetical protein|nr:hypothetical protein [Methanomassiliicoccales archaeon]
MKGLVHVILAGAAAPGAPASAPKKSNRMLILVVAAILVVAVVAAAAILLLSPSPAEAEREYQDGDYLNYRVTGWYGESEVDGWANMTMNTVTSSLVTITMHYTGVPTASDYSDSFTYTYVDGVWKSPALTGEAMDSQSNLLGEEEVVTAYGTVSCDWYQMSLTTGVYEYYVAKGTGTPVKLEVTSTGLHYEMTLESTNVDWVKDL